MNRAPRGSVLERAPLPATPALSRSNAARLVPRGVLFDARSLVARLQPATAPIFLHAEQR